MTDEQLRVEINRLQIAKRNAIKVANERSKENVKLRAERNALVEALKLARARIEYLGAAASNEKHFLANQNEFLPRIDAVLGAVGTPTS